ncbi:MAG: hypothetical protein IKW13_06535 [Thermoguttaceae bacterium]|nr:hypothetical protein [Thermoguttaceae bacterium]
MRTRWDYGMGEYNEYCPVDVFNGGAKNSGTASDRRIRSAFYYKRKKN